MNTKSVEEYRADMVNLANSIQKKANKLLHSNFDLLIGYEIEVVYCKGWFGGDDQIEDKMVMSLFFNSKRVKTITISPFRGIFGKLSLTNDFIKNSNNKKNILKNMNTLLIVEFR